MKSHQASLLAVGIWLLILAVAALPYASASPSVLELREAPLMAKANSVNSQDTTAVVQTKYFVAIFSLGPAWQKDKPAHEQLYFKEHSANLRKWRDEKKIVLGARYSDKGMIVLSARDEAEARAWLANDPMVVNQVFHLEIYPFSPFYTGCIDKK